MASPAQQRHAIDDAVCGEQVHARVPFWIAARIAACRRTKSSESSLANQEVMTWALARARKRRHFFNSFGAQFSGGFVAALRIGTGSGWWGDRIEPARRNA